MNETWAVEAHGDGAVPNYEAFELGGLRESPINVMASHPRKVSIPISKSATKPSTIVANDNTIQKIEPRVTGV